MKARVKKGQRYGGGPGGGGALAGAIINVEPGEIESAPWCLEKYEEPAPEPEAAPAPPVKAEAPKAPEPLKRRK